MDYSDTFELWKHSEQIAMHFNELLISLRTQALGGIAATVAVLVGFFGTRMSEPGNGIAGKDVDQSGHVVFWAPLTIAFALLAVLWAALLLLDLNYYHRLLEGSVEGILEIEKKTWPNAEYMEDPLHSGIIWLDLSHHIRSATDPRYAPHDRESIEYEKTKAVVWFYYLVLSVLVASSCTAAVFWYRSSQPPDFRSKCMQVAIIAIYLLILFGFQFIERQQFPHFEPASKERTEEPVSTDSSV